MSGWMSRTQRRLALIDEVAASHGVTRADIMGRSRGLLACMARDEAARRMRVDLGDSLPQIGAVLGRHHSSIWAALNRDAKRARNVSSHWAIRRRNAEAHA